MTKIYYSTPYHQGDIGKGINDFIELLPDDSWVCIRDADTMFLTPNQQEQIQYIAQTTDYDLIGCRTNRLRSPYQALEGAFSIDSMGWHQDKARELENASYGIVEPIPDTEVVAGMLMLFRKSLWNEIKIPERSIRFDTEFSNSVRSAGYKLGIAQGIYIFHMYRYGETDPYHAIGHIVHCHQF